VLLLHGVIRRDDRPCRKSESVSEVTQPRSWRQKRDGASATEGEMTEAVVASDRPCPLNLLSDSFAFEQSDNLLTPFPSYAGHVKYEPGKVGNGV